MPATRHQPTRTPRDGIEYMPSSRYPESRSHNPDTPFPNDLIACPDAMTDVHAHVLVNDLIKHDWSIERLADAWHITYASAEMLTSLPIVQREVRAYHALTRIRNDLINASRPEASTRAMLRILELPLLDPDEPGYTCHAANARANLLRITATRLLFGRTSHTPSSSSTRSSAPSPRASTHSAPSSASSSTLFHSAPPRSSAASAFNSDSSSRPSCPSRSTSSSPLPIAHSPLPSSPRSSDTSAPSAFSSSSDFSIYIPTERAPSDTTITRVACLLEEQACSGDPRACVDAHACASAGMPPDPSTSSESSAFLASSPSSNSPLPSPTARPAGALTDLHPASSLKDDADSTPRSSDSSASSAFSSPSRSFSSPPSPSSRRSSSLSADSVVPSLKDVADSPTHALRAAAGSTRPVRDPSHRARDRPAP